MNQSTFSVHFVVRSDRMDEEGYAPIYARVVLNGKKLRITTNQKVHVNDWNAKKGIPLQRTPIKLTTSRRSKLTTLFAGEEKGFTHVRVMFDNWLFWVVAFETYSVVFSTLTGARHLYLIQPGQGI